MKKILFFVMTISLIFASSNDEISKKLDILIQKINELEKKVDAKDKEIEKLKKELKKQEITTKNEFAIKSCDNIKVIKFSYNYHSNVLPYYDVSVVLKNNYPYTLKRVNGNIYFDDKDGTTLLKIYVNRKVNIKPNETFTIKTQYMISAEIEKELKNENPDNLHVYFNITKLEFANGKTLECY